MNSKIFAGLMAFVSMNAVAGGVGTQGGGQAIVDIKGIPHLRDIYDKCEWDSAWEFFVRTPKALEMLQALKKTHWVFGESMEREIKRLKLCLTGTLKKVNVDDNNTLTAYKSKGPSVQIGIRVNEDIYLDHERFKTMPDDEKALTMFHEVMHSFIPYEVADKNRNQAVRSASYAVLKNYQKAFSETRWAIVIEKTFLMIPQKTDEFGVSKDDWFTLLNEEADKKARYALIEKYGFDILYYSYFYKDYNDAILEFRRDYEDAYSAVQSSNVKVLADLLYQGVNAEFRAFDKENLLDIATRAFNEPILKLLLSHLTPATAENVAASRLETLIRVRDAVLQGRFKAVSFETLVQLGLPVSYGVQGALDVSTKGLNEKQTQNVLNRSKQILNYYEAKGVDLNQPMIPVKNDDDSELFAPVLKNETPFSYALRKNTELAAHLLAMPSANLAVIHDSGLEKSESGRIEFIKKLIQFNQIEAVREIMSIYGMNAFKRMQLSGFLRAEGKTEFADIVANTFPAEGGN